MVKARWKHVWITGGSSGIGEHTARQLARQGCRVSISARRRERLEAIASDEPSISAYPADVTDAGLLKSVVREMEAQHGPVDLAVFSSGAWFQSSVEDLNLENFARTLDVNIMGVVNSMHAVLPGMLKRRTGHLSWVSSVAGYGGLPMAASYGASKAALINIAESVHGELERHGISVSLINPGFVRSELTDKNSFQMPYLLEPEDAAKRIISGLERRKFEIAFPWQLVWQLKLLNLLPYWAYLRLIKGIA